MKDRIELALKPLVGLRMTFTKSAVDMRCFNFGDVMDVGGALIADYALHVLCPWRIESQGQIVTGRSEYYDPADENDDPTWRPGDPRGNRQSHELARILGRVDPEHGAVFNTGEIFQVEAVGSQPSGGCFLIFSGGYRLVVFPDNSQNEAWRLISRESANHFVVEGNAAGYQ